MDGVNIVGVQFRRAGKIYDFDARDFHLAVGDRVVVETERGPSLAEVKRVNFVRADELTGDALKPIVRIASGKDRDAAGRLTPEHAESFTKEKIKTLDLDMRVINVEIQFGGNKVIVYFSAPGRVDFRELVKELAGGLKTRVELKQVGARDEAKLSGGIGICGREFCCSSFLREFVPVSIKMAKNQNLALNPSKVSGGCGRLLCCLTYEDEVYTVLRQKLLPKGARVKLPEGIIGDVVKGDILNQVMQVELDTGELRSVPIPDLELVDASHGVVADDWGSDLDFDALMGGGSGDITNLDDSEEVARHRESASEPISGGTHAVKGRPDRPAGRGPGDRRPDRGPRGDGEGRRGPPPDRRPQQQGSGQQKGPRPLRNDNRPPRERAPQDGENRGPRNPDNRGPRNPENRGPRNPENRGPRDPDQQDNRPPRDHASRRDRKKKRFDENRGPRSGESGGSEQQNGPLPKKNEPEGE